MCVYQEIQREILYVYMNILSVHFTSVLNSFFKKNSTYVDVDKNSFLGE